MTTRPARANAAAQAATDRPDADAAEVRRALVESARFYLQQRPRQLPSRFLYDALGSALFDAICHLPWYRITRAERRLLARHATTIGRTLGSEGRVVELGCGNGEKMATLLSHAGVPGARAHLIDLSPAALANAVQTLGGIGWPAHRVTTHHATYEEGLLALPSDVPSPTLLAFFGSNIGNFDPPGATALLRLARAALRPGDALLLGADLVKPERDLLLAYDDPLGVTAAFNRNLLVRINRELGADFDVSAFRHHALWNAAESRVEMHLVASRAQRVRIPGASLDVTFDEGETIWTESSYKYRPDDVVRILEWAGFRRVEQWIDEAAGFALTLVEAR